MQPTFAQLIPTMTQADRALVETYAAAFVEWCMSFNPDPNTAPLELMRAAPPAAEPETVRGSYGNVPGYPEPVFIWDRPFPFPEGTRLQVTRIPKT